MNTPEMQRRGQIIRNDMPQWLSTFQGSLEARLSRRGLAVEFEGGDATGRKTEVPWVRIYSGDYSQNPRNGWYCVYLFHARGDCFYLSLGCGSTRYEDGEFKPKPDAELSALVSWARASLSPHSRRLKGLRQSIELGARVSDLGPTYEKGTAFAIRYERDDIPTDAVLERDACGLVELLGLLYDQQDLGRSPDEPSPELSLSLRTVNAIARPLAKTTAKGGQGFGLSSDERKAVEIHAMRVARLHFESEGFEVKDLSAVEPFDFVVTKVDQTLIVEVKGTTGLHRDVLLTSGEVARHRSAYPNNALVVVSEIDLDRRRSKPRASGGKMRLIHPWLIEPGSLSPSAFRYVLPTE
jgi:hypothetical protein